MRYLAFLFLVAVPGLLRAQLPVVDITLVPLSTVQYEVRVKPDATFNGLFSSLVFTLRWPDASGVTLTEFLPTDEMIDLGIYPAIAGDMVVADGYRYATHVAFGNSALVNEGQSWTPGQEVVIGTIDLVGGAALLEIVNDAWTGNNNSDFFISLNGVDRTGDIYGSSTALVSDLRTGGGFSITASTAPNDAILRITAVTDGEANYEVVGSGGGMVHSGLVVFQNGTTEHHIPTNKFAHGLYTITVRTSQLTRSTRVVIAE